MQSRKGRLIGGPALTCHFQPLSHRRAVVFVIPFNNLEFELIFLTDSNAWRFLVTGLLAEIILQPCKPEASFWRHSIPV
nr:unnamed protein product [Callosobruchus chinensis]